MPKRPCAASWPPRAPRARRASAAPGAAPAPRAASTRKYSQRGGSPTRWRRQLVDDILDSSRRARAALDSRRAAVSSPGTHVTYSQPSATLDISCIYIYTTYTSINVDQIFTRGTSSNSPHRSSVRRQVRALGRAGEFGRERALRITAAASSSLLL